MVKNSWVDRVTNKEVLNYIHQNTTIWNTKRKKKNKMIKQSSVMKPLIFAQMIVEETTKGN